MSAAPASHLSCPDANEPGRPWIIRRLEQVVVTLLENERDTSATVPDPGVSATAQISVAPWPAPP
jgi:hypothetical protein